MHGFADFRAKITSGSLVFDVSECMPTRMLFREVLIFLVFGSHTSFVVFLKERTYQYLLVGSWDRVLVRDICTSYKTDRCSEVYPMTRPCDHGPWQSAGQV
jgi:hypothetical protein